MKGAHLHFPNIRSFDISDEAQSSKNLIVMIQIDVVIFLDYSNLLFPVYQQVFIIFEECASFLVASFWDGSF